MKKDKQKGFFDLPESWEKEWQGMPEFIMEDKTPWKTISLHFRNEKDMKSFAKLVKQRMTTKTKFIWYPKMEIEKLINKLYIDSKKSK